MPPRRPASSSRERFTRIPGSARRYRDNQTGRELSYHQWYQATRGQNRSEVTAQRYGYASVSERRKVNRTALNRLRAAGRTPSGQRASMSLRKRSNAAAQWAEYNQRQGVIVPLTRRVQVNRAQAMQDPEFTSLYARFLQLARDRNTDRLPSGELAGIMVELGMRPPDFPYMVGDSPQGTAELTLAMNDSDEATAAEAQQILFGPQMDVLPGEGTYE